MVLIGTKSIHLASVKTSNSYCAGCQKYDSILLNVYSIQLHLFGLPIFPIDKIGNAFCQHCKNILEEADMSEFILHDYLLLKNEKKSLSWQLSISVLLLGITTTLSLVNKNTNQAELKYLASPIKGDIYEYKIDDTQYSTMKIVEVSVDSLYIVLNEHSIDAFSRINWIDKAENYQKSTIAFERQKINNMYNTGTILKIHRKARFVDGKL